MGYHRWFLLSFPARSARLNSAPFCGGLVALAWLYTAAVVLVPTAVGWAGYKTDCLAISCGPIWDDPRNSSYTAYLLVTGYFFPVATISATSAGLVLTMKKVSGECLYLEEELLLPTHSCSGHQTSRKPVAEPPGETFCTCHPSAPFLR